MVGLRMGLLTTSACSTSSSGRVSCRHRLPLSVASPLASSNNLLLAIRQRGARSAWISSAAVVEADAPSSSQSDAATAPKIEQRKRVLSGVQPTGRLHLGNYMGAIKNWIGLQEQYDTFFCVVDLHAITVPHDPLDLRSSTRTMAATYLASGVDPKRSTVFVQSHVSAHAELQWLLNCVTPIGWLNKMIQFKEKSRKQGEEVRAGLLTYPVLMAADILLYQADLVPVGEDQKQHLELTRDIAERVNSMYGGKPWKKRGGKGGRVFRVPEPFIPPAGARIMSLQDGTSKMSKSAENDLSRINLTDDAATIANKIKRCKTDEGISGLEFGNEKRPECSNLLTIYQLATGMTKEAVITEVSTLRWGDFKPRLADALVNHLQPIQTKYHELMSDVSYIDSVLLQGADAANEVAETTLDACKDAMGFVPPKKRTH